MQLPSDPPNCVEDPLDYPNAQHEHAEHDDHPVAVNLCSVDQLGNHGASSSGVAIPPSLMEQIERCDKADAGLLVGDVTDDDGNTDNVQPGEGDGSEMQPGEGDGGEVQPGEDDGGEVQPGHADGGEEPEATHDKDRKGETLAQNMALNGLPIVSQKHTEPQLVCIFKLF